MRGASRLSPLAQRASLLWLLLPLGPPVLHDSSAVSGGERPAAGGAGPCTSWRQGAGACVDACRRWGSCVYAYC